MTDDQGNQVTVLCVNIRPFTRILKEVLGGSGEIRAQFWEQAGMAIDQFGGVVQTRSRRDMVALWGTDSPGEDDARRAIQAALLLQDVMKQMCVGIAEPEVLPIHIGISTGPVAILPGEEGDLVASGPTVDFANRLMERAEGKILIAPEIASLVQEHFEIEQSAPASVDQPESPAPGYRVLGPKPPPDPAVSG